MCIVSAVMDNWQKFTWPVFEQGLPNHQFIPNTNPQPQVTQTYIDPALPFKYINALEEIALLKVEVEDLKQQLIAAKAQDEAEGNPDCEMQEKVAFIRRVADLVGVDFSDVFPEARA